MLTHASVLTYLKYILLIILLFLYLGSIMNAVFFLAMEYIVVLVLYYRTEYFLHPWEKYWQWVRKATSMPSLRLNCNLLSLFVLGSNTQNNQDSELKQRWFVMLRKQLTFTWTCALGFVPAALLWLHITCMFYKNKKNEALH